MSADVDSALLAGHWPLAEDTRDHSPHALPGIERDVDMGATGPGGRPGTAARFNGQSAVLEVAAHPALRFGKEELTFAAWVSSDGAEADVGGSILSAFDPATRRGVQLDLVTNGGVTSTAQANHRHLHFGIDAARADPQWTDCGRPGQAVKVSALCAAGGHLYAGTFEAGAEERGHLWRYDGGQRWVDLGNPVGCNAVQSVVAFDGALFCGTGRYVAAGSALGETRNTVPGGQVFRVQPDGRWTPCGHPGADGAVPEGAPARGYDTGKADDTIALTVFRGALYAVSNHRRGVFRYEGGQRWAPAGLPDRRVLTLAVYRRHLYALSNGGPVFRHEGDDHWSPCGWPQGSTQTYSAAIHEGRLYAGTWPEGNVFRYEGGQSWRPLPRVGYEREIMGMALYNGKVYLGALPTGSVWRLDGSPSGAPSGPQTASGDGSADGERFTFMGILDEAPAPLRRVWSLAVFGGRLYAGTLPSGRVHSFGAGKLASWDRTFPSGWHHVAAVKTGQRLLLYVDGEVVATSEPFHPSDYDVTSGGPLRIGAGAHEHFDGLLSDVRVYRRALSGSEVWRLAVPSDSDPS